MHNSGKIWDFGIHKRNTTGESGIVHEKEVRN